MILNEDSIVQYVIQIQNGIIKHVNVNVKISNHNQNHKCKADYSWNFNKCVYKNSKYFKSIANTSVIAWDEIISVMDIVSTKTTNTIESNVTKFAIVKKCKRLLTFANSFYSNHITIDN